MHNQGLHQLRVLIVRLNGCASQAHTALSGCGGHPTYPNPAPARPWAYRVAGRAGMTAGSSFAMLRFPNQQRRRLMAHTDDRQIAAILTAGMMAKQPNPDAPTTLALFFQCLDELERMDKQRDEPKIAAQP